MCKSDHLYAVISLPTRDMRTLGGHIKVLWSNVCWDKRPDSRNCKNSAVSKSKFGMSALYEIDRKQHWVTWQSLMAYGCNSVHFIGCKVQIIAMYFDFVEWECLIGFTFTPTSRMSWKQLFKWVYFSSIPMRITIIIEFFEWKIHT